LHEQVCQVFESVKEVIPNGEPVKWVFKLFNFKSLNAVRYHVKCHEKAVETFKTVGAAPKSRKSGRPTLISEVHFRKMKENGVPKRVCMTAGKKRPSSQKTLKLDHCNLH